MHLPVMPPIAPMLARLTRELPTDGFVYEPKWDGFRCLAFRDGGDVDLRSRHDRPLARYFPELVEALRTLPDEQIVLDGEIVLAAGTPTSGKDAAAGFDFAALMSRLHPSASRVERLRHEMPAAYIAFDLLAIGRDDVTSSPFADRRRRLEQAFATARPPLFLTPATRDADIAAEWFRRFRGAGVDGVVAKPEGLHYEPGKRAMVKVKHERTADCVLAGVRLFPDRPAISSLLLALYNDEDQLQHVGVVTQLPGDDRDALLRELAPLAIPLEEHPWRNGFLIGRSPLGRLKGSASRWTPDMEHDWIPMRPERVLEVGFDQVDVDRFRHPARFRRWRLDRDPRSCRLEQIEVDPSELSGILAAS
ncbi:MAG: ATP-dependent DNA ligase [Chloroflexota bacterium]